MHSLAPRYLAAGGPSRLPGSAGLGAWALSELQPIPPTQMTTSRPPIRGAAQRSPGTVRVGIIALPLRAPFVPHLLFVGSAADLDDAIRGEACQGTCTARTRQVVRARGSTLIAPPTVSLYLTLRFHDYG